MSRRVDPCEGMAKPAAGDASDSQHGLPRFHPCRGLDGVIRCPRCGSSYPSRFASRRGVCGRDEAKLSLARHGGYISLSGWPNSVGAGWASFYGRAGVYRRGRA